MPTEMGAAQGKISLDLTDLRKASTVAREAGRAVSKELAQAFKTLQAEQKLAQTQAQQTLAALKAQQAQITAMTRSESSARIAAARAEATAREQVARASTAQVIEGEKRLTAQFRSELRAREQAARASQRAAAGPSGFGALSGMAGNLAGAFGVSLGVAGAVQAGRAAIEATQVATAYGRQELAARSLAGSQSKLNALMEAYHEATGGVVDDATALANVLQLQSTGFGKNAEQLERFARAARGISIAMGREQSYVNQQLFFEMNNQTGFRLDQIGLSMEAVKTRADALRAADSSLSKEMAYQNAVLDEANDKFGVLIDSAEGQATGLETLTRAWADLRLEMGKTIQGPVQGGAGILGAGLNALQQVMQQTNNRMDQYEADWMRRFGRRTSIGSSVREPPRSFSGSGMGDEQKAAIVDHYQAINAIERSAAMERQSATEQYESQRSNTIRSYEQGIAREAQDFALSRQRQAAQLAAQIAEIHEAAAEREVEAAQDLADSIARLRADASRQENRWRRDLDRSIADSREDSAERIEDAERDHNESVAEAREDSGERLAEQQQEFDERIAEARADSAERLTEQQAELDERLTKERADSLERINDIEADYQKDRERAATAHRDTLLDAAARLDARAVWQENRRFEREEEERTEAHSDAIADEQKRLAEFEAEAQKAHAKAIADEQERLQEFIDEANKSHTKAIAQERKRLQEFIDKANEAHAERLQDESENLKERIDQEKEAHAQRVADAKEALDLQISDLIAANDAQLAEGRLTDAERLSDLIAANDAQLKQEDYDRGIRLGRLTTDHNNQLGEMVRAHDARILQIGEHAAAERAKWDEELVLALAALGISVDGYEAEMERVADAAMEGFDDWFKHVSEEFANKGKSPTAIQEEAATEWENLHKQRSDVYRELEGMAIGTPDYIRLMKLLNDIQDRINVLNGGGSAQASLAPRAGALPAAAGRFIMPQPHLAQTGTVGGGRGDISISMQVYGAPGQSVERLADIIDQRILNAVRRAAGTG